MIREPFKFQWTTQVRADFARDTEFVRLMKKAQMYCHKKFYSLKQMFGKILAGQWLSVGVAHYARKLNRMWTKRNRTSLRVVDLLKPKARVRISVDYREDVSLEL
jgi:hypothetical protein